MLSFCILTIYLFLLRLELSPGPYTSKTSALPLCKLGLNLLCFA